MTINIKHHYKFGLKITDIDLDTLLEVVNQSIINNSKLTLFGLSLMLFPRFKNHPNLVSYINNFDIVLVDGKGFHLVVRILGKLNLNHIPLPDVVYELLKLANEKNYKIFLLGATPEINSKAIENILKRYPLIKNCFGLHGYFSLDKELEIIERINLVSPDILFIGISSPLKEIITDKWKDKLNAKVIFPCGGMIDILGGKTEREPKIIKHIGLTWFYRFIQEPKRLYKSLFLPFFGVAFVLIPLIIIYKVFLGKELSIPRFYGVNDSYKRNNEV